MKRKGGSATLGSGAQRHAMNLRALHKYILELEGSLIRGSREQEEAAPFFFPARSSLARRRLTFELARISLIAWEGFFFVFFERCQDVHPEPRSDQRSLRCLEQSAPRSSGTAGVFCNMCRLGIAMKLRWLT